MSISLSSPVTGSAQTGLTTPTYTVSVDVAPDVNGKQWAVTALGGTQTGVTSHSISSPFTYTYSRPKTFKSLPPIGTNQQYANVPNNLHTQLIRKGVSIAANQLPRIATCRIEVSIPAGADTYDAPNVRALLSMAIGSLTQLSAGIGDTTISGVM